jgi:ribosome-binding factor A
MPAPDRLTRVNELLKREIADLVEKEDFGESCLVSVTGVKSSCDLRNAHVGISVFGGGDEAKRKAIRILLKHRADIQRKIARDLTLKYTPVLRFELDSNIENGDRVLSLLEEMEKEDEEN